MAVENRGGSSVGTTVQRRTGAQGSEIIGEVLEYEGEDVDHWQGRGHRGRLVAHWDLADRRSTSVLTPTNGREHENTKQPKSVRKIFEGTFYGGTDRL